ncbi:aspartate/glutamate racemase family protein [Caballeronia sp. GAWG2-1]|uniref:aspartate/glutamate racemase family protein n=1 Tax=Caballeronia sp. GAWG2-1 TaxID=2921744 RepID=UPI002029357C|nr:aspartate/glutamate racemase family protein [Caballeronia sp. GAWG2-1]
MRQDLSIVLLHATPVAMEPIHCAFAADWPEARLSNLLDDGLTAARAADEQLTPALMQRFVNLVRYGYEAGADAILATCSAFGPAIEKADRELPVPVCKPNDAMFQDALACGSRLAMIATFAPAVPTMEAEFAEEAARINPQATLDTFVAAEAMTKLRAGDASAHNALVAQEAAKLHGYDAILLAHFSTSRAQALVTEAVRVPVFAAPQSAVRRLKSRLGL